jgi:antitoxin PrlF
MTISTRLRPKSQITVPPEVREALGIQEGDEVQFQISDDGSVSVIGTTTVRVRKDQAWFWTAEWQAGEREVDAEIKAGGPRKIYTDVDEMFDDMERRIAEGDI